MYVSTDESEDERGGLPHPSKRRKKSSRTTSRLENRLKESIPYIQIEKDTNFQLYGSTVIVCAGHSGSGAYHINSKL
jgi:hypothetical protein